MQHIVQTIYFPDGLERRQIFIKKILKVGKKGNVQQPCLRGMKEETGKILSQKDAS